MYKSFIKRIADFIVALCGIIVLMPVFIILLPLVSLSNRGPVFFTQVRPGMNGKLFRLIKLKTMNDKRDSSGKLLPDGERLTGVGKLIRSLSLDELPQLINVIKGEMSLVGPRPLLPEYLPLYNAQQARRHEVRPGITGWAQVNGRNNLTWEEKFEFDIWYVDNISLLVDSGIIFKTMYKALKREGINSADAATTKPFTGSMDTKNKRHE